MRQHKRPMPDLLVALKLNTAFSKRGVMKSSTKSIAKMITAALALMGLLSASLIFSLSGKDSGRLEAVSRAGRRTSSSAESTQLAKSDAAMQAQLSEAYGKLPLMFEANTGQTDSEVKFISRGSGYGLFLTSTEAVLKLMPARSQSDPRMRGRDEIGKAARHRLANRRVAHSPKCRM
jgi:hypothetical protein